MIYGVNPLIESLHADPGGISKIVVATGRGGGAIDQILDMASRNGIRVFFQEHASLDRLAGRVAHQGVIGFCREPVYASLEEVMDNHHPQLQGDLILIADGIMDPQNLGALIRTAHCFGANGVVIPSHRASPITPAAVKASAGAVRHIPVAMAVNIGQAIEVLKEHQYWIYGADAKAETELAEIRFEGSIALVVGSEGKGIRPSVRQKCDFLFSVPMVGEINSLNVSVATGIVLYKAFDALKRRT